MGLLHLVSLKYVFISYFSITEIRVNHVLCGFIQSLLTRQKWSDTVVRTFDVFHYIRSYNLCWTFLDSSSGSHTWTMTKFLFFGQQAKTNKLFEKQCMNPKHLIVVYNWQSQVLFKKWQGQWSQSYEGINHRKVEYDASWMSHFSEATIKLGNPGKVWFCGILVTKCKIVRWEGSKGKS